MKQSIKVEVCGDYWINYHDVIDQIQQQQGQPFILEFGAEGPCIKSLGIESLLLDYCQKNNIPPGEIEIHQWSNTAGSIPFTHTQKPRLSHFFWMSERYWIDDLIPLGHEYRLAFFLGRRTIPRAMMMYELDSTWHNQCLLSVMESTVLDPWDVSNSGIPFESLQQWHWIDQSQFRRWWNHCPVPSIDRHAVIDQYDSAQNTNRDLLVHYHKFAIELVAESYCMGVTFFPTEKTIRPLMAGRPMLIYGPPKFLERLRRLGFQTWNNIWDESYDSLQGPERWQAIKHNINYIMTMSDQYWVKLLRQAANIASNNRQVLIKLIKQYQPR